MEYVCVDGQGDIILPDYVTHRIDKICKKRNLPKIKLHELRHTYASILLENGANMKDIQELLGHSDYRVTANIYSHVTSQRKQDITDKIGRILG